MFPLLSVVSPLLLVSTPCRFLLLLLVIVVAPFFFLLLVSPLRLHVVPSFSSLSSLSRLSSSRRSSFSLSCPFSSSFLPSALSCRPFFSPARPSASLSFPTPYRRYLAPTHRLAALPPPPRLAPPPPCRFLLLLLLVSPAPPLRAVVVFVGMVVEVVVEAEVALSSLRRWMRRRWVGRSPALDGGDCGGDDCRGYGVRKLQWGWKKDRGAKTNHDKRRGSWFATHRVGHSTSWVPPSSSSLPGSTIERVQVAHIP